jgi:hypothetical protein
VDGLADRGEADELIAPLRHRLGALQLARPLRFSRLLFYPLDPLIMPPTTWRLTDPALPRSVVTPMTLIVEAAMGPKMATIRESIRDRTTDDAELIGALGATFWPEAASILRVAQVPDGWDQTGLSPRVFQDLAARAAALLRQAPVLDSLVIATANGLLPPDRNAVDAMLCAVMQERADALPLLVLILLSRLSQAAAVLYDLSAGGSLPGLRAAMESATDLLLRRLADGQSIVAHKPLAEFSAAVRQVAELLAELDQDQASRGRREQIRELRQRLDRDCQRQFDQGLAQAFLIPLRASAGPAAQVDLTGLEAVARGLRVLEAEGRAIGGAAPYQKKMAGAAEAVRQLPETAAIDLAGRVRLVEILEGADAALALLAEHDRSA